MDCQIEICQQIIDNKGDFIIAVKDNPLILFADVKTQFKQIDPTEMPDAYTSFSTEENGKYVNGKMLS